MEINWLTVLATFINFIILVFILKHFLFKPVTNVISTRENEIKEKIDITEENQKKAEALRQENEEKLKAAKEEGKTIVEDMKNKAVKLSDEIVTKAKEDAESLLLKARKDSEREKEKAEEEIKVQAIDLAILLSSKALDTAIDEKEHRRLIKDFIAKVGA
jgi:F-type H+-transporting ATPase subunit b